MEPTQQSNNSVRVMKRYQDAYLVARATSGIGGTIKILGFVFGGIVALAGLVIANQGYGPANPVFAFGGLIFGAVVAIPLFVLGVLLAAMGQLLKAQLDQAVHTSPFLSDEQRASVMSLSDAAGPNQTLQPTAGGSDDNRSQFQRDMDARLLHHPND